MPPFALGAGLDVVDDQRGLWLVVDVEARVVAVDVDLELGPHAGLQVDVGFVLPREFLAQARPGPVGVRRVLRGVMRRS